MALSRFNDLFTWLTLTSIFVVNILHSIFVGIRHLDIHRKTAHVKLMFGNNRRVTGNHQHVSLILTVSMQEMLSDIDVAAWSYDKKGLKTRALYLFNLYFHIVPGFNTACDACLFLSKVTICIINFQYWIIQHHLTLIYVSKSYFYDLCWGIYD